MARGIMDGRVDIELPMISVLTILVLALIYMVTAAMGIDIYTNCGDDIKSRKLYDNLNKYMSYTLTIALTIPATLIVTKLFANDTGAFMMIYGIMGVITSFTTYKLVKKCNGDDDVFKDMWSKFTTTLYSIVLLLGIILSNRKE
jgi:hypothetical protein